MFFPFLLMFMLMCVPKFDWNGIWLAESKAEILEIVYSDIFRTVFGVPGAKLCSQYKPHRSDKVLKAADPTTYWDYWDAPVFIALIIVSVSSIMYASVLSIYLVARETPGAGSIQHKEIHRVVSDKSVQTEQTEFQDHSRRTIPRKPRVDAEPRKKKRKKKNRRKKKSR